MKTKVVIVGAGTAGLSTLRNLHRRRNDLDLTIIEPNEYHYYQPLWTLVGGGIFPFSKSAKKMSKYIPKDVNWIKEYVSGFDPENNTVQLKTGENIHYDYLVVAAGIQIDWGKIEGLPETLGKNGVCSNYSREHVSYSWEAMNSFKGGKAIFTFPSTPIKCAGAPQKVMYLAEETFRRNKVKSNSEVKFVSAGGAIFGIQKYRDALEKLLVEKDIKTLFSHDLVKINGDKKMATFKDINTGAMHEETFEMIHVAPPMSAPDFIKNSKLANEAGWVDVDKHTTQHVRYKNIFSIGDSSGLPNSKTGASIRRQGPVMISQLLAAIDGMSSDKKYKGYASCPLVISRSSCILAEFDYDGQPDETFFFNQAKPRLSMFLLKKYIIPFMYWNAMMKGYF